MEKRQTKMSKIILQFEQITDEKLNVVDNLDLIINQIFSAVDHVKKKQDNMRPKEVSDVHKYCLDVLKQLTEINSVLENLVEDNPLKNLHIEEHKYVPHNSDKPDEIDVASNLAMVSSVKSENCALNSEVESERFCRTISEKYPCHGTEPTGKIANEEAQTVLSHPISHNGLLPSDLTENELKRSLQQWSQKYGLNEINLSNMTDYYEKSSTSFAQCPTESFLLPDRLNSGDNNIKIVEIPERDTNQDYSESKCDNKIISTDTSCSSDELTANDSVNKSGSPLICFSDTGSTDSDMTGAVSLLKEDSTLNKCNSTNLISNVNKSEDKSIYTALEKLNNNYRSQEKDNDSFECSVMPDIKLKPSGTVIQNFLSTAGASQSKIKKEKKKKQKKDKIFYELKHKVLPKAGDECVMSHVETPTEFYIHVVDDDTVKIDDFNKKIKDYFSKQDPKSDYKSKEATLSEIGRFCVVYLVQDNGWYRGEILNEYMSEKHDDVLVRLVDYGNKKLVSYKNLRKLKESMSHLPMLAIQCHFPLFYPPGSTNLNRLTEWPASSIEGLLNFSGIFSLDNKTQFFKIAYAQLEGNSLAVDLYLSEDAAEGNTLGEIFLNIGLAVQILDDHDENHMELEVFLDDIDTLEVDNINEAIIGYDPRDEARICRFTKSDGTCFKGKNCKLEHVPLSKDGFTTDKEAVFAEAMYPLVLPPAGSTVTILITGYKDVCRFFAQIITKPYNAQKYKMDQEFYLLLEEMNSGKIVKTYEPFKVAPAIGEIVIFKHWNKWSRGIVREVTMGDHAEKAVAHVFVVDFGEYTNVAIKELRKIKPHFLKLPFQAVECYIHNYEMNEKCSKTEANAFFHKNLYFHNFTATTMSSYPPLKVQLKNENGLMDVGETLASMGFAVKRKVDMNVLDDCPIDFY